ncbi:MAG TPA: heme ABC transporter ATP-binding protein [Anaerolineales bacterium]
MLRIHELTVAYGKQRVLERVTFGVDSGEVVALVGPNGAGKSTLVRAVSGVVPIEHGEVHVDGSQLSRLSTMERARYLAVVPQARSLPPAFTVYETVMLGRTPHVGWLGRTGAPDRERVQYALEHTQMESLAERYVGELSGGEQQRVLLARALAQDTPVLLLDEPTTHLDLQHRESLIRLIRELASSKNLAILMVLHDLNLAGLYADRVAMLVQGQLQAIGTPAEVLTAERLSQIYQMPVRVIAHPEYGTPLVLPDGLGKAGDRGRTA